MTLHTVGAQFDERRNTSRVIAPAPDALPNAIRALAAHRRANPRHAAWLEAGAPAIHSDEEHRRWFGEPYAGRGSRRAR